ncbi:MAG: UDP-N-acetylmuramate--L-alanine ligase [Chitinophagaceae bacterium]|nr:UDP-N-acetylmuramate--L-alanine ligase [Chitinophagaceae bacterium]
MISLDNIKRIYFIGIGGIGMSALARYFAFHGKEVSGYDRTSTPLTKQLESEGIPVVHHDDENLAPKDAEMVVYTPAIPAEHRQLNFYRQNNYPLYKRSEVLGMITERSFNICVAGTHGKTTVSTMIAHILRDTGYGCNAFLGGISTNYNSNFWSSDRNMCVIEADEYDRSFLRLSPNLAVITAMDADHLDIYGTEQAMQDSFIEFSGKIKSDGMLFVKEGLARMEEFRAPKKITYSLKENADIKAGNIRVMNGYYIFDVKVNDELIEDVALNMGGLHNVENASVAIGVARQLNIETEAIKLAVEDFRGVKRRFEYIIKKKRIVYIDDYAHHPEELGTLIKSAMNLFPDKHCTVIFQPHLFSRTRDLASDFASTLDQANEVIVLPIYPARELPIPGVTAETITGKMKNDNTRILDKKMTLNYLKELAAKNQLENRLIITAGAGDIDTLVEPVKEILTANLK